MTPRMPLLSARGVALAFLLAGLLVSAAYPGRQYLQERGRIAALRAEQAAVDARIAELRARVAALGTDAEVERIARARLGMVRPGETSFALTTPPSAREPARASPPPEASAATGEPAWYLRWWDAVVRAFKRTL